MINNLLPLLSKIKSSFGYCSSLCCIKQGICPTHYQKSWSSFFRSAALDQFSLETVVFGNATPPYSYAWSTGETTPTISVPNANGTYSVTLTVALAAWTIMMRCRPISPIYVLHRNLQPLSAEEINLIVGGLAMKNPLHNTRWSGNGQTTPDHDHLHTRILRSNRYRSCYRLLAVLSTTVTQLPGPVEIRPAYHLHRRPLPWLPWTLWRNFMGSRWRNGWKHRGNSTRLLWCYCIQQQQLFEPWYRDCSYQWRYSPDQWSAQFMQWSKRRLTSTQCQWVCRLQWTTGDNTPSQQLPHQAPMWWP